jgi:hypothetical protein
MPPNFGAIAGALLLILATACGSEERARSGETTAERVKIEIVRPEQAEREWPPPEGACFVATARFEVMLTVEEGAPPGLCEDLVAYLPSGAGRASGWPAASATPAVVCDVAHDGVHVDVDEIQHAGLIDALDVCGEMVRDGWELLPLDESFGAPLSEEQDGVCFAATAHFALEVYGTSSRGQVFCDELANRHFDDPIVFRTLPVPDDPALLADAACELVRGEERIRILTFHGPRAAAERICASLEREGWRLA